MASYLEKLSAPSLSSSPSNLSLSMAFHADPILIHKLSNRSPPGTSRTESHETSYSSHSAYNPPTDDDKKKETYEDPFIYFGKLLRDNGEKSNFNTVKNSLAHDLKQQLKSVRFWSPTVESGHHASALVDLAKLLNAESHPKLDDAGKRAREGAMLIELGEKLVKQGKTTLEIALRDISDFKPF